MVEIDPVDLFFARMTKAAMKEAANVRRRETYWHVTIPHTVGFGGSRQWKVRADTRDAAIEAVYQSLRKPNPATKGGVPDDR